jgi:NAD(P)-dependent dehydrogenase (short-subunit alcohol dehydrogenase family)
VRAVVVTGASSGIGAATARALAAKGYIVYAGVRAEEDAQRLRAEHENIRPIWLDVANAESIGDALRDVRTRGVPLVGLVNNAGIAIGGPLETIPVYDLRKQFEVNCFGAIAVTQAFLPLLRERPSRVVFVGSVSGRIPMPYISPYSASKFALRAFVDALRIELRPAGVTVCLVEPGSVATPIWGKGLATRATMLARAETGPDYYRRAIDALMRGLEGEQRSGMPVSRVAGAIVTAITSSKPKAHYILGAGARIGALLALLPPAIHDRFMRATMRVP